MESMMLRGHWLSRRWSEAGAVEALISNSNSVNIPCNRSVHGTRENWALYWCYSFIILFGSSTSSSQSLPRLTRGQLLLHVYSPEVRATGLNFPSLLVSQSSADSAEFPLSRLSLHIYKSVSQRLCSDQLDVGQFYALLSLLKFLYHSYQRMRALCFSFRQPISSKPEERAYIMSICPWSTQGRAELHKNILTSE